LFGSAFTKKYERILGELDNGAGGRRGWGRNSARPANWRAF